MTETTKDIPRPHRSRRDHHHLQPGGQENSITTTMYAAMADALAAAEQDASVRVVVFQGDVAIFSAGNDIGDFLQQPLPRRIRPCSASCTARPPSPSL